MSKSLWLTLLALASAACGSAPDNDPRSGHTVNGSISVSADQHNGDVSTVNGSIRTADKTVMGQASTVNGGITLGAGATATTLRTVNGGITLGAGATAASLSSVNGGIHAASSARVSGAISTVNGSVTLDRSVDISGRLSNVNGRIQLDAAHVGGGIQTVGGDIDIGAHSNVEGGILVKNNCSSGVLSWIFSQGCKSSVVVIGPGAVVKGTLKFEHEVKLYVSDSATIGPVEGAKTISYTSEQPPV